MSDKKKEQLGMNPSTASHRLVKDILWHLIKETNQDTCCKCGEPMSRETYSVEHLTPWLDSEDPVGLYFNLNNISFSHLSCNSADARKTYAVCGTYAKYSGHNCRCEPCKEAAVIHRAKYYSTEKRQERYAKANRSKYE